MLRIGLTGGIASGKNFVSDAFAALGAPVIDADLVAREVVARGSPGLLALVKRFTTVILTSDGHLDRAALRRIIFANPDDREAVNAILHPLIREHSDELMLEAEATDHPYAVHVIPLLVETGQHERFDAIVVVDVSAETQLARLMARDGSSPEEAQAILDAQVSREARLAIADHVVQNEAERAATLARVAELDVLFRQAAVVNVKV